MSRVTTSADIIDLSIREEDVKRAMKESEELRKDMAAMKKNIDLVLLVKKGAEDKYNAEKKKRLDVEA